MEQHTRFRIADTKSGNYFIRMSQTDIFGYGGVIAPALVFVPQVIVALDSQTERKALEAIQALGVAIYDVGPQAGNWPMFSSGMQYFDPYSNQYCRVPISPAFVEKLMRSPQIRISFDVWLSSEIELADSDPRRAIRTTTEFISIDEAYWTQRILPQVGYPETRLVPLTLTLPNTIATKNPDASAEWKKVIEGLTQCTTLLRSWHFDPTDMVKMLRPAVENTLFTWLKLWNIAVPSSGKADDALQSLSQAISPGNDPNAKPCNAPNGKIHPSVEYTRLCVNLTMLHDLLQLSNVESHAKTQGTYTPAEAESLLYMTVGVVRALPQLWEQYPTKP